MRYPAAAGPGAEGPAALNLLAAAIALMLRAPGHRHLFLGELDWLLLPPLALKQCRLFT